MRLYLPGINRPKACKTREAELKAERDRLRGIIGNLYVNRGKDVNQLRSLIRAAFREVGDWS